MNISTFENHFEGKDTIIIGDYVINGCQIFHISEIHRKCEIFRVHDIMKQQVILQHSLMDCNNLEEHVNHPDNQVRIALAKQKCKLNVLMYDRSFIVRREVAKQGFGLDHLINDECYYVRSVVAQRGFGLDTLINDVESAVRYQVAKHGYGLDQLINDVAYSVRIYAVQKQLELLG